MDQVVAACEDKFDPKNNPDENERNQLIEECIETELNTAKGKIVSSVLDPGAEAGVIAIPGGEC